MSKKINPGPAGTGRGAKGSTSTAKPFTERRPFPPVEFRAAGASEEFFLHVDPASGQERRVQREEYRLQFHALHVVIIDGWEMTITRNVFQLCGAGYEYIPVQPRGTGWEVLDGSKDSITTWRRTAVQP
jgi:hypothetical protein